MKSTPEPAVASPEAPKTIWQRIFDSTPVAMTMVATLLAGLSSSEMTRAQYDRSLAAQQQSKAGDQWSFFQAKRLRGALQQNTADNLALANDTPTLNGEALAAALREHAASAANDPSFSPTLTALTSGHVPLPAAVPLSEAITEALTAVAAQRPEAEIDVPLLRVSDAELTDAVQAAKEATVHFDQTVQPVLHEIDTLDHAISLSGTASGSAENKKFSRRDFTTARLNFSVHRYEAEARLNQALASLFELQVRKSNLSADRHYLRSQRFFYGMLFAQFSVIMSTFAIAMRMRNTLWTLAAIAGLFAVGFAAYVYLYV